VTPQVCLCWDNFTGSDCGTERNDTVIQSGLDPGAKIGLIAGLATAGGLLVIGAIVGVILFMKYKPLSASFKSPAFNMAVFGKYLDPQYDYKGDISDYAKLEEVLNQEKFELAIAIATTTAATEKDNVARAFAHYFGSQKSIFPLLCKLVDLEVNNCAAENTLFRNNSLAVAVFQVYSKMYGLQYLWATLGDFLAELNVLTTAKKKTGNGGNSHSLKNSSLLNDSLELEVDPTKLEQGMNSAVNKYKLLLTTQKLFSLIVEATEDVPSELRAILHHVTNSVARKFEEAKYKAVGGFIFLRFIVPAITTPHVYGLFDEPANEACQRNLILLAKVLQNLANEVHFGAKEEHMQKLNDFITENVDALHRYFDTISDPVPSDKAPQFQLTVPQNVKTNALLFLHNHLTAVQGKVSEVLKKNPESGISAKFTAVMNQMTTPPSLKK